MSHYLTPPTPPTYYTPDWVIWEIECEKLKELTV